MAKPWAEVAASPGFQGLTPEAQEQARQKYFTDNVAPRVAPDQLETVRAKFDADTGPKTAAPTPAAPAPPAEGVVERVARRALTAPLAQAEHAAQFLTGAVAAVPASVAYGVQAVRKATGADVDPAGTMRNVSGALTYQPYTKAAQEDNQFLADAVRPIVNAADKAATAVGKVSPTTETYLREAPAAAEAAGGVLPAAQLAKTGIKAATAGRAASAVEGAANVRGGDVIERGRAAGYKFRPSDVRASNPSETVPGLKRESLVQPNDLRRDTTLENQAVTTREAATELGAKNKAKLTPEEFDELRKAPLATYDAAGKAAGKFTTTQEYGASLDAISKKPGLEPKARRAIAANVEQYRAESLNGPDTIRTISALRRRATAQLRNKDVATQDMGHANRSIADAMEAELGRQLDARGESELLGQFQQARTQLAKIHDVQSVTRAGQVDAQGLAKLAARGVPLTGRLRTIADVADAVPNVMRHSTKATGVGNSVKAESFYRQAKDVAKGIARKVVPGLDVMSEGFQAKHFGRQATPTERSYAGDTGVKPQLAPPRAAQPNYPSVDFESLGGVVPSRAVGLAGDLGLAPEPVQNAVRLPAAPDRLTADVIPPVASDGLRFTPSTPQAVSLADELGLETPAQSAGLRYVPPTLAEQLAGDLQLAPPNLAEQLGLLVDRPQPARVAELEMNQTGPRTPRVHRRQRRKEPPHGED